MKFKELRLFARSLPSVSEEPHFESWSYRVVGKIFMTVPPDECNAHIFVPESIREQALVEHPKWVENLFWGKKVLGLRVNLADSESASVKKLVQLAWEQKAPKRLIAATARGSSIG